MKFSLIFCTAVFGSALLVTACADKTTESVIPPRHEDIVSGPVTAQPFNQVSLPTPIAVNAPEVVKQASSVDDSCYTFPACVAYNKARYGH